jgi:hypothetical protein
LAWKMPIRAQLPTLRLIHVFKGYNILNLSNLLNPGIKHFIDFFFRSYGKRTNRR